MKRAIKNNIKRVKEILGVVKEWVSDGKLIEAKWLMKKVEKFISSQIRFLMVPELSICKALIVSKEYEDKMFGSREYKKISATT